MMITLSDPQRETDVAAWKPIRLFVKKRWVILSISILLLVNLFVFSDALHGYLVPPDDFHHVHQWKFGQRVLGWVFLSNTYGNMYMGGHYRPFEVLSFMIDHLIWGDNTVGRHLTNVLFHSFNAILVFVIAYFITQSRVASFIVGLLFSVHPAHYSAVSWITGRTDVIGTTFCLLAFVLFMIFIKRKSLSIYALSLVAFLCCLLMKELGFIVPLLVLSFELIFSRQHGHVERDDQARQLSSGVTVAPNAKFWSIALPALGALALGAGVLFSPGFVAKYLSNDGTISEYAVSWIELIRWYAIIIGGLTLIGGLFYKKALQLFAKLPGRYALGFFIVLALYLPFRLQVLGDIGGYNKDMSNNINTHTQISLVSFVRDFYGLLGSFWPLDYDYRMKLLLFQENHEILFFGIFAGAILLLLAFVGKYGWKHKPTLFSLLLIPIFGMPVHNLLFKMPFYDSRYLYLLTVSVCLFAGVLISRAISFPRFRNPAMGALGGIILMMIVFLAGAKLRELNERYVDTGKVMRNFVDAIEKHRNVINEETEFYFLTFPFLPIDSERSIWVTEFLPDLMNFISAEHNWTKDDFKLVFFVDRFEPPNMQFDWSEGSQLVIKNVDATRTKVIPAVPLADEISLASIYDPSWRDPHPAARTLKTLGPTADTRDAFLQIRQSENGLETATVTATFKDTKKDEGHNKLFVLYNQGEFEIIKLTN